MLDAQEGRKELVILCLREKGGVSFKMAQRGGDSEKGGGGIKLLGKGILRRRRAYRKLQDAPAFAKGGERNHDSQKPATKEDWPSLLGKEFFAAEFQKNT